MLQWILILLLIAAVASLLGFRGVAGASAGIAKILEDGTYDTITKGYFASSIYGG